MVSTALVNFSSVFLRLQLKRTVDSSLSSVRSLLHQHYPAVGSEQAKSSKIRKAHQREEQISNDGESDQEGIMEISDSADTVTAERGESAMDESSMTVHQVATLILDFLKPFLEELHMEHMSMVRMFKNTSAIRIIIY